MKNINISDNSTIFFCIVVVLSFYTLFLFSCESAADKQYKEEMERIKQEWKNWEMVGSTEDGLIYYNKASIISTTWHSHRSREFIWMVMPKEVKPSKKYYALVDCEKPRFITLPLDFYKEHKIDYSGKGVLIRDNMAIARIHNYVCK